MKQTASAPGKIILSGEYAVVFGYPGIAIPSPLTIQATFDEEPNSKLEARSSKLVTKWLGIGGGELWDAYPQKIVTTIEQHSALSFRGRLTITNGLPLQKGMGASTAFVIAMTRCLLGSGKRAEALAVEDAVNPGHSGIDFAVIWEGKPLLFKRGEEPKPVTLTQELHDIILIDTGTPAETTPELVAWVKERAEDPRVKSALTAIGRCTDRIRKGEDLREVFRDHHRAQVALGVVPKNIQKLISEIEHIGGAAKVTGAGGRTGGGGMVLVTHRKRDLLTPIARRFGFPTLSINPIP